MYYYLFIYLIKYLANEAAIWHKTTGRNGAPLNLRPQ